MPPFVASRTFTTADQQSFAALSGDVNPMHMDAIAARRTQVGAPVVHGIHTLLWALESLARFAENLAPLSAIQIRFSKPIYVGDTATISISKQTATDISLKVSVGSTSVATLRFALGDQSATPANESAIDEVRAVGVPDHLELNDLAGRSGQVYFAASEPAFQSMFPAAARWVGAGRLRGLAALSRLVGMQCPGLHSIFASVRVDVANLPSQAAFGRCINYAVTAVDDRFRLVKMSVSGSGLSGEVEAFLRMPPTDQLSMLEVQQRVAPDAFLGQRALVVGGSRGLGELAAKIVAAGGGEVTITYVVGLGDAQEVQRQIVAAGGRCNVLKYDGFEPAAPQLALLVDPPTHVYYFATQRIVARKTEMFNPGLFQKFADIYLTGFFALGSAIIAQHAKSLAMFFPSTAYLDELPKDFAEYVMAKSAGEVLCEHMNRHIPGMNAFSWRLPRLLTDQTANIISTDLIPAIDTILPIMHEFKVKTR